VNPCRPEAPSPAGDPHSVDTPYPQRRDDICRRGTEGTHTQGGYPREVLREGRAGLVTSHLGDSGRWRAAVWQQVTRMRGAHARSQHLRKGASRRPEASGNMPASASASKEPQRSCQQKPNGAVSRSPCGGWASEEQGSWAGGVSRTPCAGWASESRAVGLVVSVETLVAGGPQESRALGLVVSVEPLVAGGPQKSRAVGLVVSVESLVAGGPQESRAGGLVVPAKCWSAPVAGASLRRLALLCQARREGSQGKEKALPGSVTGPQQMLASGAAHADQSSQ